MERLISADKLKHDILNDNTNDPDVVNYYSNMVDGMETAFDVDKVIDQLEESDLYIDQEKCITVEDAVKILKGGLEE